MNYIFYITLFVLSFILTYLIKNYAIKKSLLAQVNERSSHTAPTPHGGGLAIAFAWFVGISCLFFANMMSSDLYSALMVGILLCLVSYLDDVRGLSPKIRLLTHAFVAFVGLYVLGGLNQIDFFIVSVESRVFTNTIAFFVIVWFINLYNFLDGIDGYAGSEAIFLALAAFVLFGGEHFLVLAAVVFGFLFWNWQRAKIFMGDVGSTLLGYNIAIFTIYCTNIESQNFWIWIVLFSLFWFDASLTLIRRYKKGEKLTQAHKKHAYQRLTQYGWSHQRVVFFSIMVNVFLLTLLYFLALEIVVLITLLILLGIIHFIDTRKEFV